MMSYVSSSGQIIWKRLETKIATIFTFTCVGIVYGRSRISCAYFIMIDQRRQSVNLALDMTDNID